MSRKKRVERRAFRIFGRKVDDVLDRGGRMTQNQVVHALAASFREAEVDVRAYDRDKGGKREHVVRHRRRQRVRAGGGESAPSMQALKRDRVQLVRHGAATGRAVIAQSPRDSRLPTFVKDYDKDRERKGSGSLPARDFFSADNRNKYAFAGNHFSNTDEAGKFVADLIVMGADVEVAGIYDDPGRVAREGGPYADTLYVDFNGLPTDGAVMERIKEERPDELSEVAPGIWRVWWD